MADPIEEAKPAEVMRVLGEPARWQLVGELARHGPLPLGRLAELIGRTPDGVLRHLLHLKTVHLIVRGEGHQAPYALRKQPLRNLCNELYRLIGAVGSSDVRDDRDD